MTHNRALLMVLGFLIFSSMAFAAGSCAADAYRKACSSCSFDANGKIDQSCSGGYRASGTACVSSSYPIMAGKYAAGKCPQVDSCAAELSSCVAQYATGSDKADCEEGSVAVCYSSADFCTRTAARACGEIESSCPGSSAAFLLLFLGVGFVWMKQK